MQTFIGAIGSIAPGRSFWVAKSAFLILIAWTTAADASCMQRGRFRFSAEGPWPMSLVATSGSSCEQTFRSRGTAAFKRLNVISAPSQGTVTLREGGYYRYTSKAGYRGPDAFTLRVCGHPRGEGSPLRCANLAYQVAVQ
jgi:Bacterial Ig domain